MKIISARYYGNIPRVVIRVLENPADPHWLHPDGSPAPADHTGDTEETGKTLCLECRDNRLVLEHVWTGDELQVQEEDGSLRPKTRLELLQELRGRVALATPLPPSSEAYLALENVTI